MANRQQVRRLAQAVLNQYDIGAASLTLLTYRFSATYRVDSATGRYVLRIPQANDQPVEVIMRELNWLDALRRDTDLAVSAPIANRAGELITPADDGSGPRLCVLLRWVNGQFVDKRLTPRHLYAVGRLTAMLHRHAESYRLSPGNGGNTDALDWPPGDSQLAPSSSDAGTAAARMRADGQQWGDAAAGELMAQVVMRLWPRLQRLGNSPDYYGLIHADLHQGNYLFDNGVAGAIDFSTCGRGYFVYDFGVTLQQLQSRANFAALRAALLAGYRSLRLLSKEEEAEIETAMVLRDMQDAYLTYKWAYEGSSNPWPFDLDKWRERMQVYLKRLANGLVLFFLFHESFGFTPTFLR